PAERAAPRRSPRSPPRRAWPRAACGSADWRRRRAARAPRFRARPLPRCAGPRRRAPPRRCGRPARGATAPLLLRLGRRLARGLGPAAEALVVAAHHFVGHVGGGGRV